MSVALARGHGSGDTSVFDALYGSAPPPTLALSCISDGRGVQVQAQGHLRAVQDQRAEEKAAKKEMVYQAGKLQLQKKLKAVELAQRQLAKAELAYEKAQEKVFDAQVRLTKRLLMGNDSAPDDC